MARQNKKVRLQKPLNQLCWILKYMMQHPNGISERDTNFNGFRTRISELKLDYNLRLITTQYAFTNRFGHASYYNRHRMDGRCYASFLKLYLKLNVK